MGRSPAPFVLGVEHATHLERATALAAFLATRCTAVTRAKTRAQVSSLLETRGMRAIITARVQERRASVTRTSPVTHVKTSARREQEVPTAATTATAKQAQLHAAVTRTTLVRSATRHASPARLPAAQQRPSAAERRKAHATQRR